MLSSGYEEQVNHLKTEKKNQRHCCPIAEQKQVFPLPKKYIYTIYLLNKIRCSIDILVHTCIDL